MVNKIYELKNKFVERIEHDISERGIERIDVQEMGELVDMVKDLAQAEAYCMKAKYYDSVTSAMEGGQVQGYHPMEPVQGAYASRDMQPRQQAQGWGGMRYGYDQDVTGPLKEAMQTATPEERAKLRSEVLNLVGTR